MWRSSSPKSSPYRGQSTGKKREEKEKGILYHHLCQLTGTRVGCLLVNQHAVVPKCARLLDFSPAQTRRDLYEISILRSRYPKCRRGSTRTVSSDQALSISLPQLSGNHGVFTGKRR